VPQEYIDYRFCQHMHWTGLQMDQEPAWRVELWQEFWVMELEEQERQRKTQR
jgi:hypothetical protein